jgi:hypothetical protein
VYTPWLNTILGFAAGACIALLWDFMPDSDIQGPSGFTVEEPSLDQDDTDVKAALAAAAASALAKNVYELPVIGALAPNNAPEGSGDTDVDVSGTKFVSTSVGKWNGSNRTTTYLSPTLIRVRVTAADLASPGAGTLTVHTPAPGGGTTAGLTFTITESGEPPDPPTFPTLSFKDLAERVGGQRLV